MVGKSCYRNRYEGPIAQCLFGCHQDVCEAFSFFVVTLMSSFCSKVVASDETSLRGKLCLRSCVWKWKHAALSFVYPCINLGLVVVWLKCEMWIRSLRANLLRVSAFCGKITVCWLWSFLCNFFVFKWNVATVHGRLYTQAVVFVSLCFGSQVQLVEV